MTKQQPRPVQVAAAEITCADDIDDVREQLDFRVHEYLRQNGWKTTSDTPGSLVLWEREVRGRVVLVSMDTAVHMQRYMEAFGEA